MMFQKYHEPSSTVKILLQIEPGYKHFDQALIQLHQTLKIENQSITGVIKVQEMKIKGHSQILSIQIPENILSVKSNELELSYHITV